MSEIKETVTTSQDNGLNQAGAQVQQETRKVDTQVSGDKKVTAANAVWYVIGFIEVLLAFRFVLKLSGANPASGFVNFIYVISGILTAPFDNIFGVTSSSTGEVQSVLEPSILVAIAVYALIGWGIVKLINLNKAD